MPYRSELKRPDLKGQFPCSVCGKVFCHSSSLSRHRMQAHFKCYTCTQCNQEISSNETLRSHMFRIHSISRMFMCRCCNWAFPDKTSLHIHMQSMLRNGTPGDVSVLARSSTEGPGMAGVVGELSPHEMDSSSASSSSPAEGGRDSVSPSLLDTCSPMKATTPTHANHHLLNGSIFPTLNNTETLLTKLRSKVDSLLPQTGNEQNANATAHQQSANHHWLAAWLANNPFASQLNLATIQAHLLSGGSQESLQLEGQGTGAVGGGAAEPKNVISTDTDEDGDGGHDIKMRMPAAATRKPEESILKDDDDDQMTEEDTTAHNNNNTMAGGGLVVRCKTEPTAATATPTDLNASLKSANEKSLLSSIIPPASLDYFNKILFNDTNNTTTTNHNGLTTSTNNIMTANRQNHVAVATTTTPESKSSSSSTASLLNGSGTMNSSLDSLLEKKGLSVVSRSFNRNKRKATKPQQLASYTLLKNLNNTNEEERDNDSETTTQSYLGPPEKMSAKGKQQQQQLPVIGETATATATSNGNSNATATATATIIATSCCNSIKSDLVQSCSQRNDETTSKRDVFKENGIGDIAGVDNSNSNQAAAAAATDTNGHSSSGGCGRLSVSTSHNSAENGDDSTATCSSQHKCFDCQVIKAKLGMSETRNRFLESKVVSDESKLSRLNGQINELQSTIAQYERDQRDLRHHIEKFESKLLECQERAVAALGLLHKGPESLPAVKLLMENLLECTNLTFRSGKTC